MMRMLQSGGRCASVVPDTVLTGDAQAYKTIRSALVDNHCLQAVITMPSGVFQPYSGVSTAIIIFTKTGTGGTDKVWFYDMRADGFPLPHNARQHPSKMIFQTLSPASIILKENWSAVAKSSPSLYQLKRYVITATTLVTNATMR